MDLVRLKINFLVDGELLECGSMVELERIPERFRRKKYIERVVEADLHMVEDA